MPGTKKLVIVESPAKAKTIGQYLGDDFVVHASVGHIRDLIEPKNLPVELKKGSLGKFSVDIDNDFEPYYVVSPEKKKTVAELKKALTEADELYLATDEDREGEAIAWHLLQVLKPKVPVKRMVFHEITQEAIERAKGQTRELDLALVDAQETRRILDRLYGYEVSPVLWRKVGPGLSAGRVQSAATRLIVERERERLAFRAAEYWGVTAILSPQGSASTFESRLNRIDGQKVATGRDFDDHGVLTSQARVLDQAGVESLVAALRRQDTAITVSTVESKPYTRRPAAPFITSTLQQEAARKLRFSARQTMSVAQSLYENGYITYMRTDSPVLSQQAVSAARAQASALYGADSIPASPRSYSGKSKNAQEAHEAIRPAGDVFRTPAELTGVLRGNDWKLYDLIWKRTVASQMADAKGQTASVTITATPVEGEPVAEFAASGTVITFRGFLAAYEEGRDEQQHSQAESAEAKEAKLPPLSEGQALELEEASSSQHQTMPPPRYTEASLVKALEELGIGRPSTYAAIISTIIDRGYATPKGQTLIPSWIAFSVVRLLEEHFSELVEFDFTAELEDDLDRIAAGDEDRVGWLRAFYFGGLESDGHERRGLREVIDNLGEIDARKINSIAIDDRITLRIGKYGPYLEVAAETGPETAPDAAADAVAGTAGEPSEEPGAAAAGPAGAAQSETAAVRRVNIPRDLEPDELTPEKARELVDAPVIGDRILGVHPVTGKQIAAKDGRFGPYVTELEPAPSQAEPAADDAKAKTKKKAAVVKPRTASLFKDMDPETVDLETAVKLLDLPRLVGHDAEGVEIYAQNGRYGPYLKRGTDTRSLSSEALIFDIGLDAALARLAEPKYGGRAAASALKEFGPDPVSEKPVKVKDGRFGPYVTDGITNATIPRGEEVEEITFERAIELLQIKRDKGPSPRKAPAKKAPAKKTATKKASTAKATTTKATTTKAATAKTAAAKTTAAKKTGVPKSAASKKAAEQP